MSSINYKEKSKLGLYEFCCSTTHLYTTTLEYILGAV
jgi:hypothetical protein